MKCTGHLNALTPVPEPKPAWAWRQQYKARLVVQASGGKPNPLGNDNPLALAFLGDAVWTVSTAAEETEIIPSTTMMRALAEANLAEAAAVIKL